MGLGGVRETLGGLLEWICWFRGVWKWEAVGGTLGVCWLGLGVLEALGNHWVGC